MKNCLFCKHFFYMEGSPHYSDMTPGSEIEIRCGAGLWELNYLDTEDEFRAYMVSAETCERYEQKEVKK